MYWQKVTEHELPVVLKFLEPLEPFCVNLTSRLDDKSTPGRNALTFMARSGSILKKNEFVPEDINAVVMLTTTGLFIPAHLPGISFTPAQIKKLLDHLYRSYRKIYCLVGAENAVKQYEPLLREKIDTRISYHLMKREYELPVPPGSHPSGIGIHRLTLKDVPEVFQLEKAYQYEEVLVHPKRFNPAAHMVHFRRQLADQTVLFAELDGRPVAKAATNAIGLHYSQIGGVFTSREYRGLGIARSLMIELLREIRGMGHGSILFVKKTNEPAVKLYRHLDFEIIGEYTISYTLS